jgi:hypothetical protein
MTNTEKDNSNHLIQGCQPGELKKFVAVSGIGKSRIIKVEDSIESWTNAVKEIHETKDTLGIDLTSIKDYTKQERMRQGLNGIATRVGKGKSSMVIFDTIKEIEEAMEANREAIRINRQLGTEKRSFAHFVKSLKKRGK